MSLGTIQENALGVVDAGGPMTTADVGRHLLMDYSRAKSALYSLERKGLVERQYTGKGYSASGYGWRVTRAGATAAAQLVREDD